jgi:hypothetical protein
MQEETSKTYGFGHIFLRSDITAQDVTQYKIKGYWYFDATKVN